MKTKKCTGCGKEKPATPEYYHRWNGAKCGLKPKCKVCRSKLNQEHYENNKEHYLKYSKEHYHKNKDKINKRQKRYQQENRYKILEYQQQYRNDNKEKINQYHKEWYQENKEKRSEYSKQQYNKNKEKINKRQKRYRQENKEYYQEYQSVWSRSEKGRGSKRASIAKRRSKIASPTQYLGEPNLDLIKRIYTGCPEGYDVDHIYPISKGGQHHESNLCYLPKSINYSKGAKTIEDYGVDMFNRHVIYWQVSLLAE